MKNAEAYNDPRYVDIGELPSRFHPYKAKYLTNPFDKIYVRKFGIDDLLLLSKAFQLKDKTHMLRAIDLAISVDVYDLTVPDLYYVMMWLRSYSYTDSPYVINWPCSAKMLTNEEGVYIPISQTTSANFIELESISQLTDELKADGNMLYDVSTDIGYIVADGELVEYRWAPCDAENTEIVNNKTVSLELLDEEIEDLGEHFDWPRVRNMVEIEEALKDPELALLAPQLQWMKGNTLKDKLAYTRSLSDLSAFDQAGKLANKYIFGINEEIKLTCRKCGTSHKIPVEIDIINFFQ